MKKEMVISFNKHSNLEAGWKESCDLKYSSGEDGWKGSCDLPSEWLKQDKPHFKMEMVISLDKHSSLEDGWTESCDLRIGWMKQDKLQDFKKETVISEHFSLGDGPEERGVQIDLLMDSPTKNELLKELKQCHKNLTNELLIKLMQSEDVSEGMKQLDEMVDMIYSWRTR